MARKPRIEFEGAFYHIIVRGNQRQRIFRDKDDFLKYLELLAKYKERFKYFLYAYILMSNHIHLLIETQKAPLSKILQGINQSYTMYFNKKHRTVGHLFQGRYKALLCEKDAYLLSLIKYIHLNPLRGRIVKAPDEYLWSSHHQYVQKTKKKEIVDTDQVLRMFSEDKAKARRFYRVFITDKFPVSKEDIYNTEDQRILGSEEFLEKILEEHEGEKAKARKKEYHLSEIAKGIENVYGINVKQMQGSEKSRLLTRGRKLFSLVANDYGYRGKEIAEYIRKDPAIVTRYLKEKKNLKKEIEDMQETLKN